MIDILVNGIVFNASRINDIKDHVKKTDKNNALCFLLVTGCMYCITKIMYNQNDRIKTLENTIKEMKTKGE